jgi:hypothetical protein
LLVHPSDIQSTSASIFSSHFKRLHRSPKLATSYNIVEQDHRGVKRVTWPMLGFKSFMATQDTLVGIELMHMIKKRQLVVEGDEGRTVLLPGCLIPSTDSGSKSCDITYRLGVCPIRFVGDAILPMPTRSWRPAALQIEDRYHPLFASRRLPHRPAGPHTRLLEG